MLLAKMSAHDRRGARAGDGRATSAVMRAALSVTLAVGATWLGGCSALYPEIKAPLRHYTASPSPEEQQAPKGVRWIAFEGATVPPETRDGRKWDAVGGEAPDPYALLFVNDKLLIKTPVEANTLTPTWPNAPKGNFRVGMHDRLRVELWDSNALNDHPIGMRDIGEVTPDERDEGEIRVETDTGAEIRIAYQPPHAELGLGFACEVREPDIFVTRVYEESPASRAGIKPGDQILALGGRSAKELKVADVKSVLNTPQVQGLGVRVRHADGTERDLKLKEGPVYPLVSETAASGWEVK